VGYHSGLGPIEKGLLCSLSFDIELISEKRGQGLGKLLMGLVEDEVRKLGCVSIGLNVFGHNAAAVALYEKAGFQTMSRMMKKDLD